MTADAIAGEAVFLRADVGCAACHDPTTDYTDSQFLGPADPLLHDVGTLAETSGQRLGGELTGIDTPTLRGLHDSGPYLHDGSADTVREVIEERNPTDQHGATTHLSGEELDQLEAFLLQLE